MVAVSVNEEDPGLPLEETLERGCGRVRQTKLRPSVYPSDTTLRNLDRELLVFLPGDTLRGTCHSRSISSPDTTTASPPSCLAGSTANNLS